MWSFRKILDFGTYLGRSRGINVRNWDRWAGGVCDDNSECDASARVVALSAFAAAFADARKGGAK